jgi:hypothetical protein
MERSAKIELPEIVREFLSPLAGMQCCRQRVSEPRALHFGFGRKIYHGNPKLIDTYYGEWEIGTYYCAWRVVSSGKIICGRDDIEFVEETDAAIKQIEFGAFRLMEQLGDFDIRIEFDSGVIVDFISTTSDETDECIEIISESSHQAAEFTVGQGWRIGPSNLPWPK